MSGVLRESCNAAVVTLVYFEMRWTLMRNSISPPKGWARKSKLEVSRAQVVLTGSGSLARTPNTGIQAHRA